MTENQFVEVLILKPCKETNAELAAADVKKEFWSRVDRYAASGRGPVNWLVPPEIYGARIVWRYGKKYDVLVKMYGRLFVEGATDCADLPLKPRYWPGRDFDYDCEKESLSFG